MIKFIISFFVAFILFLILLAYNHRKIEEIITNIGIAVVAGILVYAVTCIIGHKYPELIGEYTTPEPTQAVEVMKEQIASAPTPTPITIDFDERLFLKDYLIAMTSAINNNDFSRVVNYLKLDSDAYNEQKDYILNYCQENQITETLKNVEIVNTTIKNQYTVIVDTYETYHLLSPKRGDRDSSFNTQYTIEYIGDNWKISKIINF